MYIGYYVLLLHCLEQLQGSLGLLPLLADADQGAVGDYVGDHALLLHCLEQFQGSLGLPALFTGAPLKILEWREGQTGMCL